MTQYNLIDILGKAFANGETDALAPHLAKDCIYISDYAGQHFDSAKEIIEHMQKLYANSEAASRYTYSIVRLDEISASEKVQTVQPAAAGAFRNTYGLYLYPYGGNAPVAVALVFQNTEDEICEIVLSRDTNVFDIKFYAKDLPDDSPYDLPSTVVPFSLSAWQDPTLRCAASKQRFNGVPEAERKNLYIWQQADIFIREWLGDNGYSLEASQIQKDCIGYRCNRNGYAYTVYMYAYGQEKTTQLDGAYCEKLGQKAFSKDSTVLIVYLHVRRFSVEGKITYKVWSYHDDENRDIELWRLGKANGKPILEYFIRKEMMDDGKNALMFAFNNDSLDVYDSIITQNNPTFHGYDGMGDLLNGAFYGVLKSLHEKYGDMQCGYVRYNDVVYSSVPYLESYGFLWWTVNSADKIIKLYSCPFDGGERPVAEFLKTQETVDSHPYAHAPKLLKVIPFPPVKTERFALKLIFDNGEIKKYVLPIDSTAQTEEAVQYRHYVFTDKIWQSAKIVDSRPSEYPDYPSRGQCIVFKNDFFISAYLGYTEGKLYSKPRLHKETVYEDENIQLHTLWSCNAKHVYEDEETGLINASFPGNALNGRGGSTYVSRDGKRLTSLTFDYTNSFSEGLARVGIVGKGWGFIDESGALVIPPVYDQADDFKDGKAKVKRDGKYFFVDKTGREFEIAAGLDRNYQEIGELCEGLCRVSTLHLDYTTLAYYSELSEFAGIWGYVDENGNEVIPPQYIYAFDFRDGIALVCKGKWTIDKKWDSPNDTGNYWTEEELWGAIDRTGKEVIPFLFDSIEAFADTTEVFSAHYGGWETGKWGIISRTGEWLVEPIFADIGFVYKNGLFLFYQEDEENDSEDILFGVYDLYQQKVIFEPQFSDVEFRDDGYLKVEVFEESLGRFVQKIIDLHGTEVFPSVYSYISTWREPYEVSIQGENGSRRGLIDKNGNVLLPCKYDIEGNCISYQKRRMIVPQDGKQAIIDFDENVIIPAEYYQIYGLDRPLLTVRDGDRDNYKEGLVSHDGTVVIPPKYRQIDWCKENRILCCAEGDCVMLELVIKNKSKSDMQEKSAMQHNKTAKQKSKS